MVDLFETAKLFNDTNTFLIKFNQDSDNCRTNLY